MLCQFIFSLSPIFDFWIFFFLALSIFLAVISYKMTLFQGITNRLFTNQFYVKYTSINEVWMQNLKKKHTIVVMLWIQHCNRCRCNLLINSNKFRNPQIISLEFTMIFPAPIQLFSQMICILLLLALYIYIYICNNCAKAKC